MEGEGDGGREPTASRTMDGERPNGSDEGKTSAAYDERLFKTEHDRRRF